MYNHKEHLAQTPFEGRVIDWELSFSPINFQICFFLKLPPERQAFPTQLTLTCEYEYVIRNYCDFSRARGIVSFVTTFLCFRYATEKPSLNIPQKFSLLGTGICS